MGDAAAWQLRVEEFILGRIGSAPARVLEVGCGEGELARVLAHAGHSVTAIDPQGPERAPAWQPEPTPENPVFRRVGIEDLPDSGPFDYVVAVLSLHHVEDLGTALDKVAGLLAAGGALIVVEFAWERLEGATAEWAPGAPSARLPIGAYVVARALLRGAGTNEGAATTGITRSRTSPVGSRKAFTTPG